MPVEEQRRNRISFVVTDAVNEELRRVAWERHLSIGKLVNELVEGALRRRKA